MRNKYLSDFDGTFEDLVSLAHGIKLQQKKLKKIVSSSHFFLKSVVGSFSSKETNLKISTFLFDNNLYMQADGQNAFLLLATSDRSFQNVESYIEIEFESNDTFLLHQNQKVYKFERF